MSDPDEEHWVEFDDVDALKIREQRAIREAKSTSPRAVYGEQFLNETAKRLERRNRSGRPVTFQRLEMVLEPYTKFGEGLLEATSIPRKESDVEPFVVAECQHSPEVLADAATKAIAERKLKQARDALQKALRYLSSEEVSIFAKLEPEAADLLHEEIDRIESELSVPLGQRRGRPDVALVVGGLYSCLRGLTGSSLRGSNIDRNNDEEVTDLLYELALPIVPSSVPEEALRQIIETSIKKSR